MSDARQAAARSGKGRRARQPDERLRDAERSRQRLLEAALDEFAAKGYFGARVQDIAERAGVNKQLIAYYFGGKEGLYSAVQRLWLEREATFVRPDMSLETLAAAYLHESLADPRLARLLAWNGLTGGSEGQESSELASSEADVNLLRLRQASGELAADLDPAAVLLVFFGALSLPVVMPQIVRRIYGRDPRSPGFEAWYAEQVGRFIRHLAER